VASAHIYMINVGLSDEMVVEYGDVVPK